MKLSLPETRLFYENNIVRDRKQYFQFNYTGRVLYGETRVGRRGAKWSRIPVHRTEEVTVLLSRHPGDTAQTKLCIFTVNTVISS